MVLKAGNSPTRRVAQPISSRVITSIVRPILSPKWPNTTPPTGQATKPNPKVANEASVPAKRLNCGKKSFGKITAEAVPYTKKSYHSTAVPIKLASATRRIDTVCSLLGRSKAPTYGTD
jgi:hypothetical protein